MALPAFVLPTIGAWGLNRFLNTAFGGGGGRGTPVNPMNDSAIRASMISQGLASPAGEIPGSNVPAINVPGQPGIPTRNAVGIGGDAAMQQSATVAREQIQSMLGGEVAQINREWGGAGRYASGQRLGAIQEAQAGARGQMSDILRSMMFEQWLNERRIQSAEDIAEAQIEAQKGGGRAQWLQTILSSGANIFAQNPEWLKSIFTSRAGSNVMQQDPFRIFDPDTPTIEFMR